MEYYTFPFLSENYVPKNLLSSHFGHAYHRFVGPALVDTYTDSIPIKLSSFKITIITI